MRTTLSRRGTLALLALAFTFPAALTTAQAQQRITTSAGPARIFQAAGPSAASIQSTVDAFRAALGDPNNVATPGPLAAGRREINWDAVPDTAADPNPLPLDFFNTTSPRGAVFSTPAQEVRVSANAMNPTNTPIEFGGLNATYPTQFTTFSPQRLFAAVDGRNVVVVRFFVPGSSTRALTSGFGAVFTDVDLAGRTRIEYFDRRGRLLRRLAVPRSPGAATLSFAGLVFDDPVIARVRIISGNTRLGRNDAPGRGRDVVVMDDFLYGEPMAP